QIAEVALFAQVSVSHRVLDGAALLVRVRAVRKTAQGHVRAKLDEEAFRLLGPHIPQFELANPRRINDPAAEIETDQLRRRRRVLALLVDVRDLAHAQAELRLDSVEERRLADARLPGDDALAVFQHVPQAFDPETRGRAGENGRDAELGV